MRIFIKRKIKLFGKAPMCNERSNRTFSINRFVLPLCARCLGLICGLPLSILAHFEYIQNINSTTAFCTMLPMIFDWSIQKTGHYESTNFKRFSTGFLFSFGVCIFTKNI